MGSELIPVCWQSAHR